MHRAKIIIPAVLIAAAIGTYTLSSSNSNLFKGQIFQNNQEINDGSELIDDRPKPDLTAEISVQQPEVEDGDILVNVTIKNLGPGAVEGKIPFSYTIFLNDEEIFSNSDSYTTMEAGDAYSFSYPISRIIYGYPDSGFVEIIVDNTDNILEANEENNSKTAEY